MKEKSDRNFRKFTVVLLKQDKDVPRSGSIFSLDGLVQILKVYNLAI